MSPFCMILFMACFFNWGPDRKWQQQKVKKKAPLHCFRSFSWQETMFCLCWPKQWYFTTGIQYQMGLMAEHWYTKVWVATEQSMCWKRSATGDLAECWNVNPGWQDYPFGLPYSAWHNYMNPLILIFEIHYCLSGLVLYLFFLSFQARISYSPTTHHNLSRICRHEQVCWCWSPCTQTGAHPGVLHLLGS